MLAHTSAQELSKAIKTKAEQFLTAENLYNSGFISLEEFKLKEAAQAARSHARPENINLSVMLANWGMLLEPYKAVYGSVAGSDVVAWFESHGNKLFAENLRFGIEKSDVNDGIIATAQNDPDKFWYYNNGITAICDGVQKQKHGGANTQQGIFDVEKIGVINGAQTISSLHKAKISGVDLTRVRVNIRVISLDNTPDGFSTAVTNANNTQNDLNPVDFVAADLNQDRIRKEAAQIGLVYSYRRGDKEPDRESGFTIRGATIAAACASGDLRLAVSAKRYISGLWENTKKEPYIKLFNNDTSAGFLWKLVRIMNAVDDTLAQAASERLGRERLTAIHANRFLLYYVYEKMRGEPGGLNKDIDTLCAESVVIVEGVLSKLYAAVSSKFPEAYPGNIFKNQEKQQELIAAISS